MDKTALLREADDKLLHEYSRRSFQLLTGGDASYFHLPFLSTYMESNVKKEIEKDGLVITYAAERFAAGSALATIDIDELFDRTKEVDASFISRSLIPSVAITVHYEDFADIRKSRIGLIAAMAYTLLSRWPAERGLADAIMLAYKRELFHDALIEILHLYNLETRAIFSGFHALPPFNHALNQLSEELYEIMEQAARELVRRECEKIYEREAA
jgi:hypothetical protein